MNRQQRRAQGKQTVVDLRDVTFPWQMNLSDCAMMAQDRVQINYTQTKHPYHHLTASGVIVEPDPTLEYYLKRLAADPGYATWLSTFQGQMNALIGRTPIADVSPAVPVNRKYYGHDPYEGR